MEKYGIMMNVTEEQPFVFDQEKSRNDFATAVIKHNYCFNMAKHTFFKIFCKGLNPNFKLMSRNRLRSDIQLIHQKEKKRMYKYLDSISSRISLTTDIWTTKQQGMGSICITAHFVDDDWVLKKKIICFQHIEYPHDGPALSKVLRDSILDWNIDKKLFSLVVDNASTNDWMVKDVKLWLCPKSLLPLEGVFFHVRCSAHILNLIVSDGLEMIKDTITMIRRSVRYLTHSNYSKQKFENAKKHCKLENKKKVPTDVSTQWNSTYLMIEAALELKDAFFRLSEIDSNYEHNPTDHEWEHAKLLCEYLKTFYNATLQFAGSSFPTSNIFFPLICDIGLKLKDWEYGSDERLGIFALRMRLKFDKYWEGCFVMPVVAKVENIVSDIYNLYAGIASSESSSVVANVSNDHIGGSTVCSLGESLLGFSSWYKDAKLGRIRQMKTEMQIYLEEPLLTLDSNAKFEILDWWKLNASRFPMLSKIARDILAVPMTTVASEAVFSIGGRVVDDHRASLLPEIVGALITTQDWIEPPKKRVCLFN
uniref:Transposase n=1 Tax=Kalanchoe fedtschenkoi TaxID=63787 RepID=A0A7N0V8U3_KALFE